MDDDKIRLRAGAIIRIAVCAASLSGCGGGGGSPGAPGPTPTPAPSLVAETPLASDSLANSIGLGTNVAGESVLPTWPTVLGLVKTLGVRHIRDGISTNTAYATAMTQFLVTANAKLDGITDCAGIAYTPSSPTSPAQIQQFDAAIGNRLEYVEGPNEVDNRGDANWAADTTACLPSLSTAIPSLPFIAPSLVDYSADAPKLGNLSTLVNFGNIHRFFSGHNPGSTGWGPAGACGIYGALSWAMCEASIYSGSKPLLVTETGYNSQTEVDEATQAKYLSRLFLVHLKAGIARSFVYDLSDYTSSGGFGGDGLVRLNGTAKPSFAAVASEIAYFSDPGGAPATPVLKYLVANSAIDHLLFVKRSGHFVLALWNETPSWNPTTNAKIPVATQSVPIVLSAPPAATPAAVSMNDSGVLVAAPVAVSGRVMTVSVDDHVTFVTW